MITKAAKPEETNTWEAQGGIIYEGDGDSPELLASDIIAAGAGLCEPAAVDLLSREGPRLVREVLVELAGVPVRPAAVRRTPPHRRGRALAAAHRAPRRRHRARDRRGDDGGGSGANRTSPCSPVGRRSTCSRCRTTRATRSTSTPRPRASAPTCSTTRPGRWSRSWRRRPCWRRAASAGSSCTRPTRPAPAATAWRWPTARARAASTCSSSSSTRRRCITGASGSLLSESLRGEGARLVDANGREFMVDYHPDGSLAPRDIVARGIHQMMHETGAPVRLPRHHAQAGGLGPAALPHDRRQVPRGGLRPGDPADPRRPGRALQLRRHRGGRRRPVEHAAAARGRRSLVHRPARREPPGQHVAARVPGVGHAGGADVGALASPPARTTTSPAIAPWQYETEPVDPALVAQDWLTIRQTMWNYVGLVRNRRRLDRAHEIIRELQLEIGRFYARAELTDAPDQPPQRRADRAGRAAGGHRVAREPRLPLPDGLSAALGDRPSTIGGRPSDPRGASLCACAFRRP